jgi:hypothetical protein
MLTRAFIAALIVNSFLTVGCSSSHQTESSKSLYPPVWTSHLNLRDSLAASIPNDSADNLRVQLHTDWSRQFEVTYPGIQLNGTASSSGRTVKSCIDSFDGEAKGATPANESEATAYFLMLSACEAVRTIASAESSTRSYLTSESLDVSDPSKLPAKLAITIVSDTDYTEHTKDESLSMKNAIESMGITIEKVDIVDSSKAVLTDSTGNRSYITIIGRGDFNSDGIEDVLVSVLLVLPGSPHFSMLFEITQYDDEGLLKVLRQY